MIRWTLVIAASCLLGAPHAGSAELASTLRLDAGSLIAIDGSPPLPIPAGSTLRFTFAKVASDGAVGVSIAPSDVQIEPIALPDGRRMLYTIAEVGTGTLKRDGSSFSLSLNATVRVGIVGKMGREVRDYSMFFTTGRALAVNEKRTVLQTIDGQPISETSRAVKLVGATTNATDSVMGPGEVALVVLVGTFDRLPQL